jgi:hypothetical protein
MLTPMVLKGISKKLKSISSTFKKVSREEGRQSWKPSEQNIIKF